jgi:hypothetical protein
MSLVTTPYVEMLMAVKIGFLSEWQMYAQALQGDSWRGEKMDKAKIDKMSGTQNLENRHTRH